MKSYFLLLLSVVFLFACSKKGIGKTDENSTSNYDLARALATYEEKTLDFDTFSAKVKCKYEDDRKNLTVRTTIRIKKDEKIWMSAGMLGFEGVRALVTPDSVFVINRLENEYYKESIGELQDLSGLPVDFNMLQNLIAGKLLLLNEENATITQREGIYELMSQLEQITALAWLDDANFLLQRQTVSQEAENRQMQIDYGGYQAIGKARFPYESRVHVSGEEELWLNLEFSNIKLNEDLSFPFEISPDYKKGEL